MKKTMEHNSTAERENNGSSRGSFRTGDVVVISLAHMLHDIYSSFLAPLLPLLIEKLSISYSAAGLLTVVQRLPSLLNPLVGIAADKISVRYLIIVSPALTAIVMSLLGSASSYGVLVILLFVMGVSATFFHEPAPVMIKRLAGEQVGKGMSYFMLGGEIARTLGPLVILGAVTVWGLEQTWRLIPFGLLASVVLYTRLHRINISDEMKQRREKGSIKATLKQYAGFFRMMGIILLLQGVMKTGLTAFLPTFITESQNSLWMGGIALSVLQFAGAAGTFAAGSLSDRFGRRRVLLLAGTLSPLLLWLFLALDGIPAIIVLVILGLFLFAPGPVMLAMVQELDAEHPAFVNGLYMGLGFGLSAVSVFLTGALGDLLGLETTYWITGAVSLSAIIFIRKLPETRKTF